MVGGRVREEQFTLQNLFNFYYHKEGSIYNGPVRTKTDITAALSLHSAAAGWYSSGTCNGRNRCTDGWAFILLLSSKSKSYKNEMDKYDSIKGIYDCLA